MPFRVHIDPAADAKWMALAKADHHGWVACRTIVDIVSHVDDRSGPKPKRGMSPFVIFNSRYEVAILEPASPSPVDIFVIADIAHPARLTVLDLFTPRGQLSSLSGAQKQQLARLAANAINVTIDTNDFLIL